MMDELGRWECARCAHLVVSSQSFVEKPAPGTEDELMQLPGFGTTGHRNICEIARLQELEVAHAVIGGTAGGHH